MMIARYCVLFLSLVVPPSLSAIITVTIQEVGNDVVATYTGTANTTGLTPTVFSSTNNTIWHSHIFYRFVGQMEYYQDITASSGAFGPGSGAGGAGLRTDATTATGDGFGFNSGRLYLPEGYISGTSISGSMTWENTTIVALDIDPGVYQRTFNTGINEDYINLTIVPEPSWFAAGAAGIAFVYMWLRRRVS